MSVMQWMSVLGATCVGAVFLVTGGLKVLSPSAFYLHLDRMKLMPYDVIRVAIGSLRYPMPDRPGAGPSAVSPVGLPLVNRPPRGARGLHAMGPVRQGRRGLRLLRRPDGDAPDHERAAGRCVHRLVGRRVEQPRVLRLEP